MDDTKNADLEILKKKLSDLARNKQRAKRRCDHNFFRISDEHKQLKETIRNLESEVMANKKSIGPLCGAKVLCKPI